MEGFTPVPRTPLDIVTGARAPETFNAEQVKVEMKDEIVTYLPSAHPLQTLTTRFKLTETIYNYRYDWIEDDEYPREVVCNASIDPATTTITVPAGTEVRVAKNFELLNLDTGELMHVNTEPVAASGNIVVTRDIGNTGALPLVAGHRLVFIAPVAEDGADIVNAKSTKKTPKYGYTQIMRFPVEWTRRGMKIDLYGGKDPAYQRKKAGIEHAKSTELAFFFGKMDLISGTHLTTFTAGIDSIVKSNVLDVSATGNIDETIFDEWLEEVLKWGDAGYLNGEGTKYLFASARLITRINRWAKEKLQYRVLDEQIGFAAWEYESPHGRVNILHTPILDYYHSGWGYILDMNHITKMIFGGDDMTLLKGRGGNGVDGETEEYLSDSGIRVELEQAHGKIVGVR